MKPDPQKPLESQNVPESQPSSDADRVNNTLRAYREMRTRILDGRMPTNQQYLEQELAATLGMSRTPVREALIRLADERLVEVRPRHGARVLGVSPEEMADIYEICADLEATAARRLATDGLREADRAGLQAALDHMERHADGDFATWLQGDEQFHGRLVQAAGNGRAAEIVQQLMAQAHRARHLTLPGRVIPPNSNREHRDLFAAILARDADGAHAIMHAHRMRSRTDAVELLRKANQKSPDAPRRTGLPERG